MKKTITYFHRQLMSVCLIALMLVSSQFSNAQQQPLAFPGALGFGAIVTGGRGGTVYHVTNLNDAGAGSFRDAVSSPNRIVIFDVGGYIHLLTAVSVKSNITIAGQTAPGGGIGFYGGEIGLSNSNNIILRHIRVRAGDQTSSTTDDGFGMSDVYNIIFDHCSVEFAPWNNIDGVGDDTHIERGITFMNCIDADPTGQQFGAHTESVGGEWSWYYNVIANSHNRNPLAKVNTAFVNNVQYNCSAGYTTHTSTPFNQDIINNYFILGPASGPTGNDDTWFQIDANQSIYYTGNLKDSLRDGVLNGGTTTPYWYAGVGTIRTSTFSDTSLLHAKVYDAPTAYRVIGSRSGALPRDQLDSLVINQMQTLAGGTTGFTVGTSGPASDLYVTQAQTGLPNSGYGVINGGTPAKDTDGDGMPDYWEFATGSNPAVNDAMATAKDGYNLIEHYINWLATSHDTTSQNKPRNIDLYPLTGGFLNVNPVYTINATKNGSSVLLGDGHTVQFTPTTGFAGVASVMYTVKGSDGTVYADTINVAVSTASLIAPSNLTLSATSSITTSNSVVNATWTDNSTNETNFVLERSTDGITFTDIAHPAANAIAFADSNLVPNTIYYYRIKAVSTAEVSAYSDTAGIKTPGLDPKVPTVPSPANGATNVALSSGSLTLSWTGSSNTTTYSIYFGSTSGSLTKLKDTAYSVTPSYIVAGLAPNTTYYWRIDATNAAGTTTGTQWSFTTANVPTAPTNPSPLVGQHDLSLTPTLSWLGSSNTTTFSIYLGTVSGSLTKIKDTAYSATPSYVASGLTDNTTYYWRVDATNSAGTTTGTEWSFQTNTNPTYTRYRSTTDGNWGATGSGAVITNIWQGSNDGITWVNTAAIPGTNVDSVTIMNGDTVVLNATTFVKNLVIQPNALLKSGSATGLAGGTLAQRNLRVGGSVTNNGGFGTSATSTDRINFVGYQQSGTVTLNGPSKYYIYSFSVDSTGPVNMEVVINSNLDISNNIKAYFSSSTTSGVPTAQNDDNVTVTIAPSSTVTLGSSAYLGESSSVTTNTITAGFGNYIYNINGILDMRATGTSCIEPHFTRPSSITININGTWLMGNAMRMINNQSTPAVGTLTVNIGNTGIADACARYTSSVTTTNLVAAGSGTAGATFFNIIGNGIMKNRVATSSVTYPIGSGGTYSPVQLVNTVSAGDTVYVGIKSSFDYKPGDQTRVVNKQFTITPVHSGNNLTLSLGWTTTADQAANFNPAGSLVLGHYSTTTGKWDETAATISGSGTVAAPYYAKASGFTSFSPFGIGNTGAFIKVAPIAFTGCPNVNLVITRPGYDTYNSEPLSIYNLDTATGNATLLSGGPLKDATTNKNIDLNGAGLNVQDGFVYGIRDTINTAQTAQAPILYRVGSNYGTDMLGTLPAPTTSGGENLAVVNPSAGTFDDQGNYYYIGMAGTYSMANSSFIPSSYYIGKVANVASLVAGTGSLTATFTKIDFTNAPAAYKSSIYNTITASSGSGAGTAFQDITYSNLYRSLYVYAAYNTGSAYSGQLFSISPTTGVATFYANPPAFGAANNEVAGISTTASGNLRVFMTSGDIYKPIMAGSDFTSTLVKVGASGVTPLGVTGSIRGDLASCSTGSTALPPSRPSDIVVVGLPNRITAAPNPAQGLTTVSVGQPLTNATVRLLGIAGNIISERSGVSGTSFQMDLTGKAGGLYTVEVIQGDNTQVVKIMKP